MFLSGVELRHCSKGGGSGIVERGDLVCVEIHCDAHSLFREKQKIF